MGDGTKTLFWNDNWLQGQSILVVAPSLPSRIPRKMRTSRTVQQALTNNRWVLDISGILSTEVIREFLLVWDLTQGPATPRMPYVHRWLPVAPGLYYSKSTYNRFLVGTVTFELAERIWKSWAPSRCKFFIWLASLNRCWTTDNLTRRGLDHPKNASFATNKKRQLNIFCSHVFSLETYGGSFVQGRSVTFSTRAGYSSFPRLVE